MIRKTACEELVAYASRFVSARIIAEFGSGDGRYAELVSDWQEMLANQSLPTRRFDAWEAFGFPMCTDAERESHPRNFRRFRVMVNAFALLACVSTDIPLRCGTLVFSFSIRSLLCCRHEKEITEVSAA